ncbi:MAG: hypothetical protein WBS24_13800 [Terriglobales bacterium]
MGKKAIAAVMLFAIAAWAEMAMAPMLIMHTGHMRSGHEMAADRPAEHHAHHHAAPNHAENAGMAAHACCPRLHRAEFETVVALSAGTPACDDSHSCCFRQSPQSVPSRASDAQKLVRELASSDIARANPATLAVAHVIDNTRFSLRPPPDEFSMFLRV